MMIRCRFKSPSILIAIVLFSDLSIGIEILQKDSILHRARQTV